MTAGAAALLVAAFMVASPACAERIENPVAVFAALDKVTARISKLEVPLNQTVQFGSLKLTPRVCYSRPATEQPKTTSFVEVDERGLEGGETRVFTGWMFAESPGLNALEHPVFDIWLTECRGGAAPDRTAAGASGEGSTGAATGDEPAQPFTRRRVRR